jgi:hypothetical protein
MAQLGKFLHYFELEMVTQLGQSIITLRIAQSTSKHLLRKIGDYSLEIVPSSHFI